MPAVYLRTSAHTGIRVGLLGALFIAPLYWAVMMTYLVVLVFFVLPVRLIARRNRRASVARTSW